MTDAKTYWTCEKDAHEFSCRSADEAVEGYLSDCGRENWPGKLTVYAHKPRELYKTLELADLTLEIVLENLDDEFGGGDESFDVTEALRAAARVFAYVLRREYEVFQCKPAPELNIEVDVQEWVGREKPEWLNPKWPYVSTVKKEVKP